MRTRAAIPPIMPPAMAPPEDPPPLLGMGTAGDCAGGFTFGGVGIGLGLGLGLVGEPASVTLLTLRPAK